VGDRDAAGHVALNAAVEPGLCATCVHRRRIVSGRGSEFVLCERALSDPAFPRYPQLPVRICPGHEQQRPGAPEEDPER